MSPWFVSLVRVLNRFDSSLDFLYAALYVGTDIIHFKAIVIGTSLYNVSVYQTITYDIVRCVIDIDNRLTERLFY